MDLFMNFGFFSKLQLTTKVYLIC